MRATTLLLCMASALLASSQSGDAISYKMFPAVRIGLDLGSSFLRRLAEMKEKIREDIDRQAPTWTRLMNQQQPFGHVPWPVLGLQGSLSHGFQDFAVPEQQAPPAPSFAVIRPCGPNVVMPCLSVQPYGGVFPQGSLRTCGLSPASNNWLAAVGIGPCDIVLHLRRLLKAYSKPTSSGQR
ncbi:hypothetical protein HPB47_017613 [Ixodes persulcatus]|uniref:Uncharacterized protein n=1 Tax=Ixodes persulcatus TaxID=34615 RepID=A0AC60QMW8_IXOPE|nr:hypothetical protein HPB47_017613 [Ixodes persulcatus]